MNKTIYVFVFDKTAPLFRCSRMSKPQRANVSDTCCNVVMGTGGAHTTGREQKNWKQTRDTGILCENT